MGFERTLGYALDMRWYVEVGMDGEPMDGADSGEQMQQCADTP